ncbi:Interferon-induced GTP-binding protein Mx1 [Talaromyces pinophilus]|nr:Interferon-induced GTP-binding protein Mx1 [Talaromyces pinophilus]
MPLAVDSELCTRFATQIVLRRTTESSVKVSIIPSSCTDEETKQHLLKFTREFSSEEFNEAGFFAGVVNDTAEHMGLPTPGADSKEGFDKRFSGDVLKIEVFGPREPQLSVVDVPGLFHMCADMLVILYDTMYQTKEDLKIGRHGCSRQPLQPRSFRLAREADKDGSRTVGVITKCDALQRGDEKEVLNIAQNTVEKLTHGWFLVKNRSTQDLKGGVTLQERDVEETAFFEATSPWNVLSKDRVGVEPLTRFLSKLLLDHIRKEFPLLLSEIEALVTKTQEQLKVYGEPRRTLSQECRFLRKLAMQYQKHVENGLNGIYLTESGPEDPTKLRWRIRTANEENDESAVYDIHDIVKSYYKVAMKRFLDNVIIQVIERHVLGPNTPLRLFSSDFVDDSEDDQVKFIAAESSSTSMARSDLTTKLERLQKALDIAHGVSLSYLYKWSFDRVLFLY